MKTWGDKARLRLTDTGKLDPITDTSMPDKILLAHSSLIPSEIIINYFSYYSFFDSLFLLGWASTAPEILDTHTDPFTDTVYLTLDI